jgi:hypothetical protein
MNKYDIRIKGSYKFWLRVGSGSNGAFNFLRFCGPELRVFIYGFFAEKP